MNTVEAQDNIKHMTIGRQFLMKTTYLFGIGESASRLTVSGYQRPSVFEFLVDNTLKERNHLEFKSVETNRTLVTWSIHSRRKSLLFKVILFIYKPNYKRFLKLKKIVHSWCALSILLQPVAQGSYVFITIYNEKIKHLNNRIQS